MTRRLIHWAFKAARNKITTHIRGDGIKLAEWPGDVTADGLGYGVLGGAKDAWRTTRAAGHNWMYADGPYFLRKKGDSCRLAWNSNWYTGIAPSRKVRSLEGKGCILRPWRKERGSKVFVCPSNHMQHQVGYGDDAEEWLERTMVEVQRYTGRPVVARWKGKKGTSTNTKLKMKLDPRVVSMEECFEDAWAIVTAGSTIGCEALAYGIPVFTDKECASSPLALSDLTQIDTPYEPRDDEREAWAHNLCARQFDTTELRSGKAWTVMREDIEEMEARG